MGWERRGECNHCGWCCTGLAQSVAQVSLGPDSDVEYYRRRGFKLFHREGRAVSAEIRVDHVAPCPLHLNERCAIYTARPKTCAAFPTTPEQIIYTPCSYWFENERGERLGGRGSPHPPPEG